MNEKECELDSIRWITLFTNNKFFQTKIIHFCRIHTSHNIFYTAYYEYIVSSHNGHRCVVNGHLSFTMFYYTANQRESGFDIELYAQFIRLHKS